MKPQKTVLLLLLSTALIFAEQGAKYLIIAYDPYVPILQPIAHWKTKKGFLAKIVPVSQIGNNPTQIQSYIRNAYNNWPIKPEYVLLAGSPAQIPAYGSYTDCYYGNMSGDYVMEISVGRFFATTARECSTMVAKVLAYERQPFVNDSLWLLKMTTCVREDNAPDDTLYWADSRLLHEYGQNTGYILIDSFSANRGNSSSDVTNAVNDGRAFLTYRGQGVGTWWTPFNTINPFSWVNGMKMPLVIGATCATIVLEPSGSMYGDKFVRAGNPQSLGGAIAYFGTTGTGSGIAHYRSAVFRGFLKALFDEKITQLGRATLRGRWRCDSIYHQQARYEEWNLLGDPELNIWTEKPQRIEVVYDSVIQMIPQVYTVEVTKNGQPVFGATVCLSMDSVIYTTGVTDEQGRIYLNINPTHIGIMDLVVTGRNLLPWEKTVQVIASGSPYLIVTHTHFDDYSGNQDGVINPGERCRIYISLLNVGGITASEVEATLRINTPYTIIHDSTAWFGSIEPESVRTGDPFELFVDSITNEGDSLYGTLILRDAAGDSWLSALNLVVRAGRIVCHSLFFNDSLPNGNNNGRMGRLESGRIRLNVENQGGGGLQAVVGILSCADSNVYIVDSLSYYGEVLAGENKSNEYDQFAISIGPGMSPNRQVRFVVRVLGFGGTYYYRDTFSFILLSEPGMANEPTGPDNYGYWCYDDTDTASGRAPIYQWFELAPPGPGEPVPAVSDSDAVTRTLQLPFDFKLYGFVDSFISICSNGFLALRHTTYRSGNNRPIPDTVGPPLMIAPFWDDLNPDENRNGYGTAYQYYDTSNHRFIIEFKEFAHYDLPNIRETFQVIIYDPDYYPTTTGDGEIVFQYQRVSLNSSCTVGIEDATETAGIQYLYNNLYDATAAYLQAERTIKFTTNPPVFQHSPWLILSGVSITDSLHGNRNGFFESGETLDFTITIFNRGTIPAQDVSVTVRSIDDAVVIDSTVQFGTIVPGSSVNNSSTPFRCAISQNPRDSIANFSLLILGRNYFTTAYFSIGISGLTAVEEGNPILLITGLNKIFPNPCHRTASIYFTLAQSAQVDLGLFDIVGRRVLTITQGYKPAGQHKLTISNTGLSMGIYFCRLKVKDGKNESKFNQKFLFLR